MIKKYNYIVAKKNKQTFTGIHCSWKIDVIQLLLLTSGVLYMTSLPNE